MKRWSLMLSRLLIALAIVIGSAGVLKPVTTVDADASNPDAWRTGDLPDAWRWVDTLGTTGSPYPADIQGSHLYGAAGIAIDSDGKLFVTEENGKRLWGFADQDFTDPVTTPITSGLNDPFWQPHDVTRNHDLTWVIDSHHLVVLDDAGTIVKDFQNFEHTIPSLGWVNNNFQCANSLSFDALTDLLYVMQNCGSNAVLVLRVEKPATGDYFPDSLTLVDAFRPENWYKHHIQTADLNNDAVSEVYISGDNGALQCQQPASMPGDWTCNSFAQSSLHRARGLTYSAGEHALYALDTVGWDWGQNGVRKCLYNGTCTDVVTNNNLQNTPNQTMDNPQDLALAPSGEMYITDASKNAILKLSVSGELSYTDVFGVLYEPYITDDGYLNNPSSVLTDSDNNLYVAESSGRRVLSFDAAGTQRWVWGTPGQWSGNESAEICNPQGNMALDPAGNLYVPDRCSGRIVILDKDSGVYLASFRANSGPNNAFGFNGPAGVAFASANRLFVSDPDNHRVQEFKYTPYAGWSYFSTIGISLSDQDPSSGDGALMDPSGLAFKGENEAFIADRNYNRVQKCTRPVNTSSTWTCVNLVGTPFLWGNSNYLLGSPENLALDAAGRLFVADNNNNRIQVFDSLDGTYLGTIGTGEYGTGNDRLMNPNGIALDSAGNVYVADTNAHRVQKYLPTVPPLEYVYQQGGVSIVSYRSGDFLFSGYGHQVHVYDIATDPAQPVKIGQSQSFDGTIQDILVSGNYAYVLTSFGSLAVLDISTPSAPVFIRESLVLGSGQALALDETDSNLYVLQNGPTLLSKYNLTDPASPAFTGVHWLNGWAYDVVVSNNRAYVSINNGPNSVISFDSLDLSNPDETTELDTAQTAGLALDGTTLYAADPGFGLYQLDTTTPGLPNSLAMDPAPTSIHLEGEYGFATTNNSGFVAAIQISGTSLTLAGNLFISNWRDMANSLEIGSDTTGGTLIYLSTNRGLATYRVDTSVSPVDFTLGSQETPDFSTGWQTQTIGNTLYTIDLGSLKIFDVSDPITPVLLNTLSRPETGLSPFVVRQEGNQRILYILAWEDFNQGLRPELRTYDVTNPANLVWLDSKFLQNGNSLMTVAAVGDMVVAAVTEGGFWDDSVSPNEWHRGMLELFDVTDPAAIAALPALDAFDGNPKDIAIQENYLFITEQKNEWQSPDGQWNNSGGGGLRVYDISGTVDPTTPLPAEEKAVFGSGDAQFIDIEGATVFETDSWEGVSTLTIDPSADPSSWIYQSIYRFSDMTNDIQVASVDGKTYAWVTNNRWLRILDVTDPTPDQVSVVASYSLPYYTAGLSMSENVPWLWLSGYTDGMSAWWAAPTLDEVVSTPGQSLTSSLDDVTYTFVDDNLRLWHTPVFQGNLPPVPAGLIGINRAFETKMFGAQTELPVTLTDPYTLAIGYDMAQLGMVDEGSLKLYYWNGTAWVVESSTLDRTNHVLIAHPNHFSTWSVLGAKDSDEPSGTIVINAGAMYATSPDVTLTLTAGDSTTTVEWMRFKEDEGSWSGWEAFNNSKSFTLAGGQGLRSVSVQFKDEAGNISILVSDSITLDSLAPTGSAITINGGEFIKTTAVTLTPASTGAAWMRFSENDTFSGVEWIAYSSTDQNFSLSGGDGLKHVYAQYKDAAGNTAPTVNDTVTLDTLAPTGSAIAINGGEFTKTSAVTLTPASTGAAWMRFSEDTSFTGVAWVAYNPAPQPFDLSASEGLKTVFAQYKDAAGNMAPVVSDTVTVDTTAPVGMILINNGVPMTSHAAITLQASASGDVTHMRFMETNGPWPSDWSAASPFAASANFNLTGSDGTKTVFAQFLDTAGNVSTTAIQDSIILDTTGPDGAGSLLIEGGAAYTTQAQVWLSLTPTDGLSGVSQMKLSNAADGSGGSWAEFSGFSPWTLDSVEGSKTVYVWYRDGLGNETGPFSDTILFDSTKPSGGVTIAGGDPTTTSSTVILTLSNPGSETNLQMRLNNDVTALLSTSWETFSTTRNGWALISGNGVKSIFVQFKDAAGNLSPIYEDTILVDDLAPTGFLFINGEVTLANDPSVNLFITFMESGSGVVTMRTANSAAGLASATEQPYTNPLSWTLSSGDGDKTVCVQLKDAAGNESAAICDTITLDTTAPTGSLLIDNGAADTHSSTVTLSLTASDTNSGMGYMMVSNLMDFSDAVWQPYATSLPWTLTSSAGVKTVYVKYMDLAGNVSNLIEKSITYRDWFYLYLPNVIH